MLLQNVLFNPVFPESFRIFIPPPQGEEKGLLSEKRASEALAVMVKRGKAIRELKTPPIIEIKSARGDTRLERKGIDFVVTHEGGYKIPVQIKSSKRGARRFARKHKLREVKKWFTALTQAVVVEPFEDIKSVIRKIAHYLNTAFLAIKRFRDKTIHRTKNTLSRTSKKSADRLSSCVQFRNTTVRH
jgi:hypothetical protein